MAGKGKTYRGYFDTVIALTVLLKAQRLMVCQIASRMSISERTVYRMFKHMEKIGVPVEQDFDNRYFILEHNCPLCGRSQQPTTNEQDCL